MPPQTEMDRPPVWTASMTAILLAGWGLAALMALSGADAAVTAWIRSVDGPVLRSMAAITDVALVQWYLVPAALLVIAGLVLRWRSGSGAILPVWAAQAVYAFVAIGGAQLFVRLLKMAFGRARPALIEETGPLGFAFFAFEDAYWSFPSGHSTTAGALAAIGAIWFPKARGLFLILGVFLATTRVPAGAHFPSDVCAGLTTGLLFALLVARTLAARGLWFRLESGTMWPRVGAPKPG